jgi:hypothetical protein
MSPIGASRLPQNRAKNRTNIRLHGISIPAKNIFDAYFCSLTCHDIAALQRVPQAGNTTTDFFDAQRI